MIGSILGDIAGSTYEFAGNKNVACDLFPPGSDFTDDTVMLVATAETLLTGQPFDSVYRAYGRRYPAPMGGYGARFGHWLETMDPTPYDSWGNGSAMRAGPVGWAYATLEETLREAKHSAEVTHNHAEGIKGAQATAAAIWLARTGASKDQMRAYLETNFGYDLRRTCDEIRPGYRFVESAAGTVPEAIIAFLDSSDYPQAIRLAVSLGGDADTLACITGGIAHAFYKEIPPEMVAEATTRLDAGLAAVVAEFSKRFNLPP